jgi:uncharacterized lipoprotein YajG
MGVSTLGRSFVLLAGLMLASCAAQRPQPLGETPALTTEARIEVGEIHAPTPFVEGVDTAALLGAALSTELGKRGILWAGQPGADRFTLASEIVHYEPGNAFKRWLLPGYGATVLTVRGSLTFADGGAAGAFEHGRGVYAGGLYSVGAWKSIFDQVAADIARDLDNRIRRRGFTVSLPPWSSHDVDVPQASRRGDFGSVHVHDARSDRGRIGTREAAFGVAMGDVFFARDVEDFLGEAVADQLRAAGHAVGSERAPVVSVEVAKFWLHTETTMLYWDVVGEVAIDVSVGEDSAHRFDCRAVKRTYVWPSEALLGEVLDECLVDLMAELIGDPMWTS